MILLFATIISCSIFYVNGDVIQCSNKSITVDNHYSWPNNTYLAPGQDCTYKISFDNSSLLLFLLDVHYLTNGDAFYINDAYGNEIEKTSSSGGGLNIFPPPSITVRVTTGPVSKMKITLLMVPEKYSLENVNETVIIETSWPAQPEVLEEFHENTTYVINTNSGVALSVVGSSLDRDPSQWMGIFVYEGTGTNAVLIGTLFGALSKPMVSSGKSVTLYSTGQLDGSFLVINDYSIIEEFSHYETGWAYDSTFNPVMYSMDASKGPIALTIGRTGTFSDATYLRAAIVSDPSSTISVMSGPPSSLPANQLFQYNGSTIDSFLPQQFPLKLTTFVLDKGIAKLDFTGMYYDANWTQARLNRHGYLMTNEYPASSGNLKNTYLGSGVTYDFKFEVLKLDRVNNGNEKLNIVVDGGNSPTVSISISTLQTHTIHVTGYSVQINLNSSSTASGTLLSFEMNKPAQPSTTTPKSVSTESQFGLAGLLLLLHRMF